MVADEKLVLGGYPAEADTHQCNDCGRRFNGYPMLLRCCCRGTCGYMAWY